MFDGDKSHNNPANFACAGSPLNGLVRKETPRCSHAFAHIQLHAYAYTSAIAPTYITRPVYTRMKTKMMNVGIKHTNGIRECLCNRVELFWESGGHGKLPSVWQLVPSRPPAPRRFPKPTAWTQLCFALSPPLLSFLLASPLVVFSLFFLLDLLASSLRFPFLFHLLSSSRLSFLLHLVVLVSSLPLLYLVLFSSFSCLLHFLSSSPRLLFLRDRCLESSPGLLLTACRADQYTCHDGTCIRKIQRCDLEVNCPDQSDEQLCKAVVVPSDYITEVRFATLCNCELDECTRCFRGLA